MKAADYAELQEAMFRRLGICETRAEYEARGLTAERHRWDMLWGTDYSIIPLYEYLNDDHIDTALRHIVAEFEGQRGGKDADD